MILPGSSSAGATTSASPASMALRGMPSNLAEAGACTKTTPAFSLMARRPSVPSEPMPERMTPMLLSCWSSARERKKKSIGRRSPRGAAGSKQVQRPVEDGHVLVGRDHVDVVRLDLHAVPDLDDLHGGGALEQLHHDPLVGRVQVLDDDEGHAASRGHVLQEQLQGLQAAGGGADADDGKSAARGRPVLPCGAGVSAGAVSAGSLRFVAGSGSLFHGMPHEGARYIIEPVAIT